MQVMHICLASRFMLIYKYHYIHNLIKTREISAKLLKLTEPRLKNSDLNQGVLTFFVATQI